MFIRKKPKRPPEEPLNTDELFDRYNAYVNNLESSKWKTFVVGGLALSALLITAASLPFDFINQWIYTAVGTPAGVLLFLIGLGAVYRTSLKDSPFFQMRQNRSFKSRLKVIALWYIIFLVVFIPIGSLVPYGLGGSLLIALTLTALTTARRTPQEMEYVKQGIPDPRDLDSDDLDETDSQPASSTTINPEQEASGRIK